MKPYTYLIKWSKLGKCYYGAKYGKDANPSTFWKDYFTSSKYVQLMREEHGEPDVIQIRRTFDCREKALLWERKVLTRVDAVNSEEYLNRGIGGSFMYEQTPLTKKKIGDALRGKTPNRVWTEEQRKSIGIATKERKSVPVTVYSTLQDKTWHFNSHIEMRKEWGIGSNIVKKMQKGWVIKKLNPWTTHPFEKGDTIYSSR